MILTREQIDAAQASHDHYMARPQAAGHDPATCWTCSYSATARAYHDLRDAVLGDVEWVTTHGSPDGPAWLTSAMEAAYALGYHDGAARIGEVVARVERGDSG